MGSTNGVSRGQLRPYLSGRTPPFLLIGLLVVMGILGFSYWSLNTQYNELQTELQKLEERLRIYAEKRESVEKQNSALQTQLQTSQNEEGKYKIALDKKQQEVNKLSEELRQGELEIDKLNDKINMLTAEKTENEIKLEEIKRNNPPKIANEKVEVPKKSINPNIIPDNYAKEETTISQSKQIKEVKNPSNSAKVEASADPDVGPPPENREARDLKTTTKMPILLRLNTEQGESAIKLNPSIKNENPEITNNNI